MGFWNSFKNQVGRDTGRRVSRALYGKKHATLIEHTGSCARGVTKMEIESLLETKSRQEECRLEELTQRRMRLEFQQDQLEKLTDEVNKKIAYLNNLSFPNECQKLTELANGLIYLMECNFWNSEKDSEKRAVCNRYSDAIFAKLIQMHITLKLNYPNTPYCQYYNGKMRHYRFRHFRTKHKFLWGVICYMIFVLVVSIWSWLITAFSH